MREPETVTLGGRSFELQAMPWGQLKRVAGAIQRVGMALSAGVAGDAVIDDMGHVLCLGLGLQAAELEALPTDYHEVSNAFRALMRVSGMEAEMEHALGEARRRGLPLAGPAPATAKTTPTPGTASTPTPPPAPAGPGASSTE
jgi:hypothetical protein